MVIGIVWFTYLFPRCKVKHSNSWECGSNQKTFLKDWVKILSDAQLQLVIFNKFIKCLDPFLSIWKS